MELKITEQALQPITFNFDELKDQLETQLQHYNSITYTEDKIKEAKADRATLNKFKDAIENRRKEIKKAHMKPYEDFEKKVKELVALVDKPILAIDGQVKAYEIKDKEEKRAKITKIYEDNIGDLAELLPLTRIWDEKWLNSSVKINAVTIAIVEVIDGVRSDLEVISGLNSEFELQIKDTYLRSLNLSSALQEKSRLEEQKAKQEAYDKARAEEKAKAEEVAEQPIIKHSGPIQQPIQEPEEETIYLLRFEVRATRDKLMALSKFLKDNNFDYRKVD